MHPKSHTVDAAQTWLCRSQSWPQQGARTPLSGCAPSDVGHRPSNFGLICNDISTHGKNQRVDGSVETVRKAMHTTDCFQSAKQQAGNTKSFGGSPLRISHSQPQNGCSRMERRVSESHLSLREESVTPEGWRLLVTVLLMGTL